MAVFEDADASLLPGFERRFVDVGGNPLRVLTAGEGPPLLLLHGDPQTHLCWHRLAPALAEAFSVVLPDIRGRGESHKPGHDAARNAYSKRDMAAEQLALMQALGHQRFGVVGHDRGARVARRLALDHPDRVDTLTVMDIVPALDLYENVNAEIAQDYFYFWFLTQDFPIPDRLIAGDPEGFLRLILDGLSDAAAAYHPLALRAYLAGNATPEALTAMCECFRAGYHVDRDHDRIDRAAGNRIACPTLVMWGARGVVGKHFDVRAIWSDWCERPTFAAMPCGHFIPEEAPGDAIVALRSFLEDAARSRSPSSTQRFLRH